MPVTAFVHLFPKIIKEQFGAAHGRFSISNSFQKQLFSNFLFRGYQRRSYQENVGIHAIDMGAAGINNQAVVDTGIYGIGHGANDRTAVLFEFVPLVRCHAMVACDDSQ